MQELFHTTSSGEKLRYAWFRASGESPKGTVLCLHGRTECIEIYAEQTIDWNHRNFDVVMFDWRGQGGSGRAVPDDPHRHHIASFSEYRSDLREFHAAVAVREARAPLLLFAHSMGGCVALDWLSHDNPESMRCAILTAPMLAIPVPTALYAPTLWACRTAIGTGFAESYVPGEGRFDLAGWRFESNLLTSDPARFRIITDCFTSRPDLSLGGVTWGWLHAAIRAIEHTRNNLERIKAPTLVLTCGEDRVVPYHELRQWIGEIPNMTEKFHASSRHTIMLETDAIRSRAWNDIDRFLEQIF